MTYFAICDVDNAKLKIVEAIIVDLKYETVVAKLPKCVFYDLVTKSLYLKKEIFLQLRAHILTFFQSHIIWTCILVVVKAELQDTHTCVNK